MPNPRFSYYTFADNNEVYSVGWGQIEANLQNRKLKIIEDKCKIDKMKQLCAGDLPGLAYSCPVEFGSPLFSKDTVNGNERYVLVGLLSIAEFCGSKIYPA